MGMMVYGTEHLDNGAQLLTLDINTGEQISEQNFIDKGNGLQVIFDKNGNPIVLTEYRLIHGEDEYLFPEKVKFMAYSEQENVALAFSSVDDNLHVIDLIVTNIETYPIYTNSFVLNQNTPNPVTDFTNISYKIKEKAEVNLSIFDNSGKIIQTYNKGVQEKGEYNIEINTSDLKSGIYFYKLSVNNQSQTKKMIVL